MQAPATDQAATGSRPELLVAHSPVLVLTAQQQPAAAELLQLVQTMGGVSAIWDLPMQDAADGVSDAAAFVDDLGVWLSCMSDASKGAECDTDMRVLGNELLVRTVGYGSVEVAQLVVSAMVQSSASAQAVGEQGAPWFLAAAKPAAFLYEEDAVSPLLHAAMASGNADMLEKVLR